MRLTILLALLLLPYLVMALETVIFEYDDNGEIYSYRLNGCECSCGSFGNDSQSFQY